MDQPSHIIDPDGEVIIILRNANPPFAELDEATVADMPSQTLSEPNPYAQSHSEETGASHNYIVRSKKGKKRKKAKRSAAHDASFEPFLEPAEEPAEELAEELAEEPAETGFVDGPSDSERTSTYGGPTREINNYNQGDAQQDNSDEDFTERNFSIQVSAKHLTLASSVFKKMLTSGLKEAVTYLQKRSVEIETESWDVEALLILLRVMHCQHNRIPRKLSLEMLAKVAVLADYYNCKEAVSIFADIWIDALEERSPMMDRRNLILWLWISWYFQVPGKFQETTSIVMSRSNGSIDSLGLPIPNKVLESMNYRRHEAINNIVLLLHEKCESLLSGRRGCCFECGSIMYGALAKQMQSNALLSPKPVAPFMSLNYEQLVQKVLSFESPQWSCYTHNYRDCLDSSFPSLLGELNHSIEGFDLHFLMDRNSIASPNHQSLSV
ncbi:hypothetical protein AJ80_07509 [Polytolypa hystricis UAMH7299]|uniref:BTB domain-containing protein n=1 Tax=Polytolypa hystricis (strain UAMH7299) TaxID=1447883 RepID=A0A2B7XMU2_POLH7|nr:hypothetical protein AJ80_07509 [Polytolypa hystricis UAMH7299]